MADQTPETPEALARAVLYGDVDLEQSADLIRTRDAALIAQHTAELTATAQRHLEERDHYRGCYLEMVTTREHIADLKAQLATAKQERTDAVKTLLGCIDVDWTGQREPLPETLQECAERAKAKLREWEERAAEAGVDELEEKLASATARIREFEAEQSRHLAAALDLVASYKHQTEELAERAAELTARLEAANAISRSRLRGLDEAHEHITSLEAQLTASAQREASARAEAREAALREAKAAVVALYRYDESQPDTDSAVEAIRKLLTSPPPPRVDAWVPVSERMPEQRRPVLVVWKGRVQWATWRFNGSVWESDLDGVDDAARDVFSHWQPLPPPPSAEPANGGSDAG